MQPLVCVPPAPVTPAGELRRGRLQDQTRFNESETNKQVFLGESPSPCLHRPPWYVGRVLLRTSPDTVFNIILLRRERLLVEMHQDDVRVFRVNLTTHQPNHGSTTRVNPTLPQNDAEIGSISKRNNVDELCFPSAAGTEKFLVKPCSLIPAQPL